MDKTAQIDYKSIFDDFPEGCQVISPEFRYVYVNSAVAKQGKSDVATLTGKFMTEAYPGIDQTPMFEKLKSCLGSGEPDAMKNKFDFPDGSTGWYLLKFRPVPDGILIISEDVTEIEKQRQKLEKMNKFMVNRELDMADMKRKMTELRQSQAPETAP